MKKFISLIVVLTLFTGCAGTADRRRTESEGTRGGAFIGYFVGSMVGQILDGDKGSALGALLGAALGGTLGYAYGNHVANKKEEYANTEDYLNACIASAQKVNLETQQYNAKLITEVKKLNLEANQMIAQYRSKEIQKTELNRKSQEVQVRYAEAQGQLRKTNNEIALQKNVLQRERANVPADAAKLDHEISKLQQAATELENHTRALAAINQQLRL